MIFQNIYELSKYCKDYFFNNFKLKLINIEHMPQPQINWAMGEIRLKNELLSFNIGLKGTIYFNFADDKVFDEKFEDGVNHSLIRECKFKTKEELDRCLNEIVEITNQKIGNLIVN